MIPSLRFEVTSRPPREISAAFFCSLRQTTTDQRKVLRRYQPAAPARPSIVSSHSLALRPGICRINCSRPTRSANLYGSCHFQSDLTARQTPEPREGHNGVWSHFLTAQGRRALQPGGLAENSRWQAPRRHRNPPDPGNSPRRGDRKLRAHRRPKDSLATPRTPRHRLPPRFAEIASLDGKVECPPFAFSLIRDRNTSLQHRHRTISAASCHSP